MTDAITLKADTPRWGRADAAAATLLVGLNCLWLVTVTFPFFCADDSFFVRDNVHVTRGLSWESITWAFTTTFPDYWHPLTWLSLALDSNFFGTEPWGYHLTNAVFHIANAVLVYALLRAAFGGVGRSLLAAAIFSLHPQRVESVAWITERKDVLAVFFGLLALLAYVQYVRRPGSGRYMVVVLLFVASLLAKPLLVTFPCLLLLMDYWPLRRLGPVRFRTLVREKVPLFLFALGGGLNTCMAVATSGTIRGSLPESMKQGVVNYVLYLRDSVYFGRLCFFNRPLEGLGVWQAAGAVLVLAAMTAGLVVAARKQVRGAKAWLFGWLWFVITLFPASGVFQAGYSMRGDRFMYVPSLGLVVGVIFGIGFFRRKALNVAAGCCVVAALGCFTAERLWLWHDPLALCEHDLKMDPDNAYLEEYAGAAAKDKHLDDTAMVHFRRAAKLNPSEFWLADPETRPGR